MATRIQQTGPLGIRIAFDGPALPEKTECSVELPEDRRSHPHMLDAFMGVCEDAVAAAMKRARYGGGLG